MELSPKNLGVKRLRKAFGGNHDPRPGDDEFVAAKQEYPVVLDGRQRRKRVPDLPLVLDALRFQRLAVVQFDNDFRRATEDHLRADVDRLLLQTAENVRSSCQLEHVVKESVATAGIDVAQSAGIATEHQKCRRPWPSR